MIKDRKKIRILTVIRYPIGGIRTYLKYTYGNLDNDKYSIKVVTAQYPETKIIKEDLEKFEDLDLIEVKGRFFLLLLGFKILEMLRKNHSDIIHSHGSSSGIIVSAINLFFGIPHIITFHETFDANTIKGRLRSLKKKIISFLFSRADFLNVVSNDARINLLDHFPLLNRFLHKITVIQNGVDTSYFNETINNEKKIYEIDEIDQETFVLGFLGRFMPEKGFLVLVDAIDRINRLNKPARKFKVLVLGWGAYVREYQAYIRKKNLSHYFVFIGFQSDIRWVLRGLDLLVVPSLREAFPLLPIEAAVSGTPVIASNCIGLREVLIGTPARMVKAGDPEELADAIIESIKKPMKSEALEFITLAKARFDVKVTSKQLESLFEEVMKRKQTSIRLNGTF